MAGQVQRIAALLIAFCSAVASGRSVYHSCGAVVDSEAPGVILSPGFPTGYAAGTHCVWQFFIPPGARLHLEVFDFDVFESPGEGATPRGPPPAPATTGPASGLMEDGDWTQARGSRPTGPAKGPGQGGHIKTLFNEINASDSQSLKAEHPGSSVKSGHKRAAGQRGSNMLPLTDNPSVTEPPLDGSLEPGASRPTLTASPAGPQPTGGERLGKGLVNGPRVEEPPRVEEVPRVEETPRAEEVPRVEETPGVEEAPRAEESPRVEESVEETPRVEETPKVEEPRVEEAPRAEVPPRVEEAPAELCPDDVLYISDLITFSVRFCGANSPVNETLTFGSPLEMVEVVMELITSTGRGRGFLLLYHLERGATTGLRNLLEFSGRAGLVHSLLIGGIGLLLALVLTAVCRTWRKRTRYKGRCSHCAKNRVNGIQNSAVDVGEMQLVANGTHQDVWTENENNNHSVSLGRLGGSLHAEMEVTSTESVATESESDEIFVISAGPGVGTLHFSSFKTKVPKRSATGSSPVCNWRLQQFVTADGEMAQGTGRADSPTGQRAAGTDVARPPPTDWCGWTSTGPFAQLTENCMLGALTSDSHVVNQRKVVSDMRLEADWEQLYSDSAGSAASYPLSRSAQSQRQVTSATNLRRAWFGSPCFGFRPSASSRHGSGGHNRAGQSAPPGGAAPGPLLGSSVTNGGTRGDAAKARPLATESDRLNLPKPVFVISEARDDREPLVQAADTAGHSGDVGHFEEIHPNRSSPALEGERLVHPVSGTT